MDPLTQRPLMVPPSGHVAGVWARTDDTRGVHKAPANEVVLGVNGLGLPDHARGAGRAQPVGHQLHPRFPGRGIRIWGARTLSSDPEWRYLNVRRLFNYVSESIMEGTQWAVFEPNDERLWIRLRIAVGELPRRARGARARCSARRPSEAFFVKCDAETNPPDVIEAGPGRHRGRHRAGQAGRVRDLPHQPVQRRRGARSRVAACVSTSERSTDMPCKRTPPSITLPARPRRQRGRGHVQGGLGARLGDRGDRAQVDRRQRPADHPQGAGRDQVVEHHAQARRRREPRHLEVARARSSRRVPTTLAHDGNDRADRLHAARRSPRGVRAGLADQVHGRHAQRLGGNEVALEEIQICHEGLERM